MHLVCICLWWLVGKLPGICHKYFEHWWLVRTANTTYKKQPSFKRKVDLASKEACLSKSVILMVLFSLDHKPGPVVWREKCPKSYCNFSRYQYLLLKWTEVARVLGHLRIKPLWSELLHPSSLKLKDSSLPTSNLMEVYMEVTKAMDSTKFFSNCHKNVVVWKHPSHSQQKNMLRQGGSNPIARLEWRCSISWSQSYQRGSWYHCGAGASWNDWTRNNQEINFKF